MLAIFTAYLSNPPVILMISSPPMILTTLISLLKLMAFDLLLLGNGTILPLAFVRFYDRTDKFKPGTQTNVWEDIAEGAYQHACKSYIDVAKATYIGVQVPSPNAVLRSLDFVSNFQPPESCVANVEETNTV